MDIRQQHARCRRASTTSGATRDVGKVVWNNGHLGRREGLGRGCGWKQVLESLFCGTPMFRGCRLGACPGGRSEISLSDLHDAGGEIASSATEGRFEGLPAFVAVVGADS